MKKKIFERLAEDLSEQASDFYKGGPLLPDDGAEFAVGLARRLDELCATDEERLLWLAGFADAVSYARISVAGEADGFDEVVQEVGWLWAIVADDVLWQLDARGVPAQTAGSTGRDERGGTLRDDISIRKTRCASSTCPCRGPHHLSPVRRGKS